MGGSFIPSFFFRLFFLRIFIIIELNIGSILNCTADAMTPAMPTVLATLCSHQILKPKPEGTT